MKLHHLPTVDNPELAVTTQNESDLYLLSKMIKIGDLVRTKTTRKLEATTVRKSMVLTIKVKEVAYRQQELELQITGAVQNGNENVAAGSSHTLHVFLYNKISLFKQDFAQQDLTDVVAHCDQTRTAAEALVLLTRDGIARLCFVEDGQYFMQTRFTTMIPQKNQFNSTKIDDSLQKFFVQLAAFIQQKLTDRIKQLTVMGMTDLLDQFKKFTAVKLVQIDVKYQTTKQLTLARAFAEVYEADDDAVLQELKKRLHMGNDTFLIGGDCLKCFADKTQRNAMGQLLVLKNLMTGENRDDVEQMVTELSTAKDCKVKVVSEQTETGQTLKSYAGMVCLTKYQVYLEKTTKNLGQEFTAWDHFSEISGE